MLSGIQTSFSALSMFKAIDIFASSMLAELEVKFQYAILQPLMTMDSDKTRPETKDETARSDVYVERQNMYARFHNAAITDRKAKLQPLTWSTGESIDGFPKSIEELENLGPAQAWGVLSALMAQGLNKMPPPVTLPPDQPSQDGNGNDPEQVATRKQFNDGVARITRQLRVAVGLTAVPINED